MSLHRCYIISMSSIRGPEAENSAAALPGELWRRRGEGGRVVSDEMGVGGGGGGGEGFKARYNGELIVPVKNLWRWAAARSV